MHGPTSRAARLRGAFAVVTALGALAALGVLAGASWSATGSSSSHHEQYGNKVTICHHTHSKTNPQVTITVGPKAAERHLKHGDTLGACPTTTTTTGTTGTTTTTKQKDDDGNDDDNVTTTTTSTNQKDDDGNDDDNVTTTTTSGSHGHDQGDSDGQGHDD